MCVFGCVCSMHSVYGTIRVSELCVKQDRSLISTCLVLLTIQFFLVAALLGLCARLQNIYIHAHFVLPSWSHHVPHIASRADRQPVD